MPVLPGRWACPKSPIAACPRIFGGPVARRHTAPGNSSRRSRPMSANEKLAGKVALVTGAASGIGAQTARLLADHGAKVVAADRNLAGARQVAEGIGALAIGMDVTS